MAIGFIGLGNLGSAVAKRLTDMGEKLKVYNRTKSKALDSGYEVFDSPKELIDNCDIVFMCLFESLAVENIFEMENGLLSADLQGKTIIDLTTNHYEKVLTFHNKISQNGGEYLEAPIFGSVIPALQGAVTIVASGEKETFDECKPLLEKFGKEIFYLKEPGKASKMKLINNLCLGSFMATIAECTALGEACDIEKPKLLEILGVGGGQSLVLKGKTQKLIEEDFSAHFSNNAIYKDLHTLQDLAYSLNQPLFTAAVPKELFGQMKKDGRGEEDFSSIYQLFK
ncbi:NAD(P)-dependent oxidoreductase [Halarcobacter ebronensis]|uniref:6-phosphogluconate dehydrogenase n=1 Tax=Halarcobacter ebronensis TaxID=1462615 RepID=A0A4Q1ATK1_9BACT|nr:NAD(P)-dependent oxidoreductase [Halarcobacter ebronensis]QKF80528.1 3-hydroxyisobutyrate dehydrogenase family beta-hydroxyacid dehydrogenase [Halarcobacter ebronensis]RXK08336.1 6-phosphogluconate dehydrogenase [Halarcobacter ebronensis]